MEGRVERALRDLDYIAGDLLQTLSDRIAMDGTQGDDFQDQQVEGALREIGFGGAIGYTSFFYMLDEVRVEELVCVDAI